jgi:cytoskeletal protein RodZ
MSLPKHKMLLAPLLAVVIALLLVGATSSFPPAQRELTQTVTIQSTQGGVPSPQPTEPPKAFSSPQAPSSTELPTLSFGSPQPSQTGESTRPMPTPKPTAMPMPTSSNEVEVVAPAPTSALGLGVVFQWVFIVAAVVVAVVAVWVFSSERNLNKAQ